VASRAGASRVGGRGRPRSRLVPGP
jgi:hypothetical protein